MSIRVALHHKTEYSYNKLVTLYPHIVRLRPAPHCRTPVRGYSLKVNPSNHFLNWQQDPFGNYLARLVFPKKANYLSFDVDLVVDMTVINPFDFFLETSVEDYPFQYDSATLTDLAPYLQIKDQSNQLIDYIHTLDLSKKKTIDFLWQTNQRLQRDINYIIRMEPGVQTPEETLKLAKGSCRDSAWLLVQIFRHLGIAARFASGYLIQLTPDVKSIDGPSGPEKDFTDLHAWTEVYLPGAGWIGLDPTSGLFAGEGHIPLACTPDPISAAPVTGYTEKAEVKFSFEMSITRLNEKARTTKPYTEEQWKKIYELGKKVDQELLENDVRLTMGGEPTFICIDDMDGAEWNTDALGPTKKRYATDFLHRLKDKFGYGALLHFGQGKWYPGESLPRWALGCFWRKDGIPIWNDPSLYADESISLGMGEIQALQFIKTLTTYLGITDKYIQPGYEDVYYYLWKEGNLPINLDPFDIDLKDSEERVRLRKILERGLDKITGFALPLRWDAYNSKWQTGPRTFRRGRMYLIPGDSPMGFRLPMDSFLYSKEYRYDEIPSTFEKKPPLKDFHSKVFERKQGYLKKGEANWVEQTSHLLEDPNELIRTTLCVEPRNGNLYIFIPPMVRLEEYLDLIAAVELTARELQMPVIIEGYTPPFDYRINKFMITPDPGVIEVNIHPAHSWEELNYITETLYEQARYARLSTEKFMLDGRHTGTGGGNHITIGGPTPMDSPILRRPDLLKSLLIYWQNHPSLSYLFSGLFVGPTSQAPRIDEARHESLNELEIAFKQLSRETYTPLWLVDRLFRNLLVDITGNTHRAEFCIDKLYSPDQPNGRLGLVEMRAFEMPPHSKMSLSQTLLLRAIISRFWKQPLERKLVRFGTELHDKYMLAHYVWEDFKDVIYDMNNAGYEFEKEWFEVFLDFRFPFIGSVQIGDIGIELRTAMEPWYVLGEEGYAGTTTRFVDSSVERLQVKVTGMTEPRHVLLCNGRRVPLKPTGVNGEFVAGVKYKAWNPPSCLHPQIGVHTPLVFDIVDTWNKRSIGGCTYHVSHPGGRNYTTFPVNANEAESRRISRFFPFGHTPGIIEDSFVEINPEFAYTLDLRK